MRKHELTAVMASAGASKHTRIQWKHVFIAVIIIVSTLLLIASIAMITIGYLNPFGTVGLGILGGGCVLYFSAILVLCSGGIWIKNKYYADENDQEKWYHSASEDISLLKPASNVTAPSKTEAGCIKETEYQLDNNTIPLCSVSTVYSSVSSSASTVPERTMLFNCQDGDAEKDLDYDVFSSSLTAMQQTDMKLQEKLQLKQGLKQPMNCETSSDRKIKDLERKKIADLSILHSNAKYVSDIPRQRNPVVMDFVETKCSSTEGKQLLNHYISDIKKEENNSNINLQIGGRSNVSNMSCSLESLQSYEDQAKYHQDLAEQSKHMYEKKPAIELPKKQRQECKPALEEKKMRTGKDSHTPERHWSIISEGDSWIHNPRVEGKPNKDLNALPAMLETENKHRSYEKPHTINQERTELPLKKLLPNTRLDQLEKVPSSSQKTTSGRLGAKVKFMMKN
ncbi:uncharacterized protein LOC143764852 [Ranitomeya variabilis]|uniref:uncharacterized protein LOC143764852 n=1 Tax=Ranitomeya variabilis TaxID=490064 RepID=UPI004056A103